MDWLVVSLLVLFMVTLMVLAWLLLKSLNTMKEISVIRKDETLAQLQVLSKMSALLASKDPIAFQAIQAMDSYSTSDLETVSAADEVPSEEELDSIVARYDAGERLTDAEYERIESAALGSYHDPSLDIR